MKRALSIHHVHGDKEGSLCKDDAPKEFVPLCDSCHGKTHAKDKKKYYEDLFTSMIQERMSGRCYCKPEEVLEYLTNQN